MYFQRFWLNFHTFKCLKIFGNFRPNSKIFGFPKIFGKLASLLVLCAFGHTSWLRYVFCTRNPAGENYRKLSWCKVKIQTAVMSRDWNSMYMYTKILQKHQNCDFQPKSSTFCIKFIEFWKCPDNWHQCNWVNEIRILPFWPVQQHNCACGLTDKLWESQ